MNTEIFATIMSAETFAAMLRLATPLALGAIAAMISERMGVINVALEGLMLVGAFAAVLITDVMHNPWLGLLGAVAVSGSAALAFAFVCLRCRANQLVAGWGLNILAAGLTTVALQAVWNSRAYSATVQGLPLIQLPFLRGIPWLHTLLSGHSPTFWVMVLIGVVGMVIMHRTPFGLRIRATSDNPAVVRTAGLNLVRLQYVCLLMSGVLCGLAGVDMSLGQVRAFGRNMVAGRGFIALAMNILGGWSPAGDVLASVVMGFFMALQMRLHGFGVPSQFTQMVPYVLTLLVLAGFGGRHGPAALALALTDQQEQE